MPKLFGFSGRKMKLGRLKVHLGDPSQGTKSPMRPTKRLGNSNAIVKEENLVPISASGRSEDRNCRCSLDNFYINKCGLGNSENWAMVSTGGSMPFPRMHHAAAVVGNKMVVVGGESSNGLLDDTMILNLDKLIWAAAAPKVYQSPTGLPKKIPACRGHCLVSWGKAVLLIGGKTVPPGERVSVLSFDIETECWSHVEAKGDIPAARSGHTATRAGSVLIVFGGEDAKGRKLNDLHMFDLKSLTWLPLHYTGTGPSPRSNHVSALYDDKILLVFGGHSKSRTLNDLYSLDFETMVWSRIKTRGHHPSPRAGSCGSFCGTKWYIVGGGSKKKRHAETLVFDISKYEWSVYLSSPNATIITNKGFSLATVHQKSKTFLVAFGGNKKESLNQIETLLIKNEHSMSWRSAPDTDPLVYEDCLASTKELAAHLRAAAPRPVEFVAQRSLAAAVEQHISGRKSISDASVDMNPLSGSVSLRKQFHNEEDYNSVLWTQKSLEDGKYRENNGYLIPNNPSPQGTEQRGKQQETTIQMDIAAVLASAEESIHVDPICANLQQKNDNPSSDKCHISEESDSRSEPRTSPSNIHQLYETKISTLTRKNALLEEQLTAALAGREAAEKNLSSVIASKQDMERKLIDAGKEVELLKEKLAEVELAQEEANSLSNIVHSDNVRLEHDVAFLKAVLDDTQKELHSTRGVLAVERARAFQLQVEVFHLKQRLQSMENRAPTPRKPYHV
ncbi:acyl-CoA-binding domain-containing protein 5-like [Iris pallida]|uniref:Acyl-CoA-binding domain-containing protein 5-like n=1 Tax=Iris pallida TaxID=29817 RepID=A0AAX6FJU4_IRIPA|nr:acyl-CoA-binding domain-containing protein 5-like [Iris pallida]